MQTAILTDPDASREAGATAALGAGNPLLADWSSPFGLPPFDRPTLWSERNPPGSSQFTAYRDLAADPPALVVQVGATQLRYHARCVDDLHAMLRAHGDWLPLGGADEQKPAANGTVEAWARASTNPVGGWYGLKKGLRGRFAVYVPPVLEALGLAEVEHAPRNNRMRALARPR